MKFILGKKIEMSQIFNDTGGVVPVTRISAGPCFVDQVKNLSKDGYAAVKLGFQAEKRQPKKSKATQYRYLKEFRIDDQAKYQAGQEVKVSIFEPGDLLKISGFSKGKGFQGVVRRHHFSGAPASHGTKDQLRMPGSIGATFPQHVLKGKRMAGRMGHIKVTVSNLEVVAVDENKNELLVKGAVPGPRHELLVITATGEKAKKRAEAETAEKPEEKKKGPKKPKAKSGGKK